MIETKDHSGQATGLVSATKYLRDTGRSRTWLWRLAKAGILEMVNVCGKNFITSQSIAAFEARARAGEFARRSPIEAVNAGRASAAGGAA